MPRTSRVTEPTKSADIVAKKRRFRPGTVALRGIRKHQTTTTPLLQRAPVDRVIRGIGEDMMSTGVYWQRDALEAIRIMLEDEMVKIFQHSVKNMVFAKRTELMDKDWDLYLDSISPTDLLVRVDQTVVSGKAVEEEEE